MEAGQKFFTATAGYTDRAYAFVGEHTSIGSVAGIVAYRRYDGSTATYPEGDCFATKEEAKAACITKLRRRKEEVHNDIESEIKALEAAT